MFWDAVKFLGNNLILFSSCLSDVLAGLKAVLSLEVNILESGNWLEVEARKGKQMDSEVLDIDE